MVVRPVLCRRFIGRADELAYLDEKRSDAARSHGSLVFIAGEAGVGKSRLIAEFCSRLGKTRWRLASGTCLEHAQRPYGPVLDVLARLEASGDSSLAPEATKREQLDAVIDRFTRAAAKHGIIAIVEDVHWADTATLELLAVLASRLASLRMLLLVTFRSNELPHEHGSHREIGKLERAARSGRIDLAPLAGTELRSFIDEALEDRRLPEEVRRTIAGTSDGNPFFAEELLKAAVERTSSATARAPSMEAPPFSIRAALLERWRRLDENDRRIIAQAAVIGRTFDVSLLANTLDAAPEDVLPALRRARDVQLLDDAAPACRFRHALTREAIYSAFLGAEVAPLHRKIALALEAPSFDETGALEDLAYHWWAAGDDMRSVRYNVEAGDAAARVHAHEDAVRFFRRALEAATLSPAERAAILEKLVDRFSALGRTEHARDTIEAAAEHYRLARAFEQEARCRIRGALIAYALHLAEPTQPLEAMLARLEPPEYIARSLVHLGIAWLKASYGYPTEARAHLVLVDERARTARVQIALRYHNVAAWVAMTMGDLDTFRTEHAAWIAAAPAGPMSALASAHINGAFCYATFGLHADAAAHVAAALAQSRADHDRQSEESVCAFSACCSLLAGDLEGVRSALAGVSPTTENQVTLHHAAAWGTLAGIHLGDSQLAQTWYDAIGDAALDTVDEMCGGGFAEILVRRGRPQDAAHVLRSAVLDCERMRGGDAFTLLAAARYGDPAESRRARRLLAAGADGVVEVLERHALKLFDAYTALREKRPADAIEPARAAAAGFARLGFPLLQAAAHEAAGDVQAAVDAYRACGAIGSIRRLESTITAVPESVQRAPARPRAAKPVLSLREREIVNLVALGSSNREIAARLDITAKTVEKHLGSAYRKLGISSRARLAVYAAAELSNA